MAAPDVYFVGTIPLMRTLDVFNALADTVGARAPRVPDGEIGDRKLWVNGQYSILAACPALEPVPYPKDGLTRRTSYELPLRLRPNAREEDIAFGELGYARYAHASFTLFDAMQKAGKLPKDWRFQVNLPMPMDVMPQIEPGSRARVEPHYARAMMREVDRILADIPNDRLAITWDVVQGVLLWESPGNSYVTTFFDDALDGTVARMAALGDAVAPGAELGYHLCYGSQDHKHAIDPKDLGACVRLTNAVAEKLARDIDYVHMPVPRDRDDEAYFAPLAELTPRVKHVYLGLIHYTDGVDGAKRRMASARKFREDFGVATECGFGRRPSHQDVMRLIELHAAVAAA